MLDEDPLPLFPDAPRTPPLRQASGGELEHAISRAIRSGVGARHSREADLFLSTVCARLIADHLLSVGFVIALPSEVPRVGSDEASGVAAATSRAT